MVFGSDADDIVDAINSIDTEDFIRLYYTNDADVPYVYGPSEYYSKLNALASVFGVDSMGDLAELDTYE